MFEWFYKRRLSPLGQELVDAFNRGDTWVVSEGRRSWKHQKSGVQLWISDTRVRVLDIPGLSLEYEERDKLLNFSDKHMLRIVSARAEINHDKQQRANAAETALNLLRLSQHKENQP